MIHVYVCRKVIKKNWSPKDKEKFIAPTQEPYNNVSTCPLIYVGNVEHFTNVENY